jgi:hypothetical protein
VSHRLERDRFHESISDFGQQLVTGICLEESFKVWTVTWKSGPELIPEVVQVPQPISYSSRPERASGGEVCNDHLQGRTARLTSTLSRPRTSSSAVSLVP